MAELKTRPSTRGVAAFLGGLKDVRRRKDAHALVALMKRVTGARPRLWGPSIVGFGRYHYRYASGREGDWFLAGFSPRKASLVLYIMSGFEGVGPLLEKLGPHRKGASCLYLKSLDAVDSLALERLVKRSVAEVRRRHA
jgi:hypothetical protein